MIEVGTFILWWRRVIHYKGMLMSTKTLTLKSISRSLKPTSPADQATPTCVIAGRSHKKTTPDSCPAVIERLNELVKQHRQVFIQMRHGAGYRGLPTKLQDGWLTMTDVSIYGTKQKASSPSILIQLRDGSFIAHLHAVDGPYKAGVQK